MSGIGKALFGSKDKVSSAPAQLYPESQTQAGLRKELYDTTTGILSGAGNNYNTGTGLLALAASGQLSGDTAANLKKQAMGLFDKQAGSIANNMAFKNLGSNTMTQNALSQTANDASDWYMNNYLQALQTQGSMGSNLASLGLSGISPAQGMWGSLLNQQTALSNPAQTTVRQGSSGLLGSFLGGGGAAALGKKWWGD